MPKTDFTPREHMVQLRFDRFKLELPALVEALLAEIPRASLRELVRDLAMTPNEILPKRSERPQPLVTYTMNLLGRALGLRDEKLQDLLVMTIAFVEAGDVYDDAVDGDYLDGHLHHLLAVSSTLHFVATRAALRLGAHVAEGWLKAMFELPHSLILEKDGDGSLSTYLEAVQAQAALFGALGRVAAEASGAEREVTEKIVELTKLLYAYLQYPQDLREAPRELSEKDERSMSANIMRHMGVEGLRALFQQVHAQMQAALPALPENRDADHLRALIDSMRPW